MELMKYIDDSDVDDEEFDSFFKTHNFDRQLKDPKRKRKRRVHLTEDKCLHGVPSVRDIAFKIDESKLPAIERMQSKM